MKATQEMGRKSGQRSCIAVFWFQFGWAEERGERPYLHTVLSIFGAGVKLVSVAWSQPYGQEKVINMFKQSCASEVVR